ncbi:hypothetical protein B0A49_00577 [Cryomyces minteri]|uniref:Uncharacterized protein n=1 Tax=Cryomyces minteri TaxID=331657 RepID=A0A4U0Y1A7_9PEZI|nr:hypothetical protein B0A49_00577 [Cryomyces minteri]
MIDSPNPPKRRKLESPRTPLSATTGILKRPTRSGSLHTALTDAARTPNGIVGAGTNGTKPLTESPLHNGTNSRKHKLEDSRDEPDPYDDIERAYTAMTPAKKLRECLAEVS